MGRLTLGYIDHCEIHKLIPPLGSIVNHKGREDATFNLEAEVLRHKISPPKKTGGSNQKEALVVRKLPGRQDTQDR